MAVMDYVNITRSVKIDPILTAHQWQLYTLSLPRTCDKAAKSINAALKKAVNSGLTRNEVYEAVEKVMYRLRNTGAADTEPRGVLADILDNIFGVEGLYAPQRDQHRIRRSA